MGPNGVIRILGFGGSADAGVAAGIGDPGGPLTGAVCGADGSRSNDGHRRRGRCSTPGSFVSPSLRCCFGDIDRLAHTIFTRHDDGFVSNFNNLPLTYDCPTFTD